jgi:glutamate-1-semialdehyde 2,1-aminomutase
MAQSKPSSTTVPQNDPQALYRLAKTLIPGGTQLLSKRPELYAPDHWPSYYREAKGCEVVDIQGRRFIDMTTMGIGSCPLGYADPDVTAAVVRRVQNGSMCTLNNPEEVELAQLLVQLHPWAENVRFARTGGEAMAVAARIARAKTGRDLVAICGYHGWHDWYLAANLSGKADGSQLASHLLPGLEPRGVPSQLAGTTLTFTYNHLDELAAIVDRHGDRLAAVIMEPTRSAHPEPGFLEGVRAQCDRAGAVWVIDEITAGWRFTLGGAHLLYGVQPDIAVFAKALGNGHPMAAIVGRAEVMQASQGSFISSTYWTEGVGPTAALATLHKMQTVDLPAYIAKIGTSTAEGLKQAAARHGVPLETGGHPALMHLKFNHPDNLALQTLFTVRMLDHGFLGWASFYPSLAHTQKHVDAYVAAADKVFPELAEAIAAGDVVKRLGSPVRHSGFARLT